MARRLPLRAVVVEPARQPLPKQKCPEPVGQHAGHQRIFVAGDPAGQIEPGESLRARGQSSPRQEGWGSRQHLRPGVIHPVAPGQHPHDAGRPGHRGGHEGLRCNHILQFLLQFCQLIAHALDWPPLRAMVSGQKCALGLAPRPRLHPQRLRHLFGDRASRCLVALGGRGFELSQAGGFGLNPGGSVGQQFRRVGLVAGLQLRDPGFQIGLRGRLFR